MLLKYVTSLRPLDSPSWLLAMCPLPLTLRVKICGFLFTSLIILDIIGSLNTMAPLFSDWLLPLHLNDTFPNQTAAGSWNSGPMDTQQEPGNYSSSLDGEDEVSKLYYSVTIILLELFGLCTLLMSNSLALLGLRRAGAYLLVPWLFVYFIGTFRWANVTFII